MALFSTPDKTLTMNTNNSYPTTMYKEISICAFIMPLEAGKRTYHTYFSANRVNNLFRARNTYGRDDILSNILVHILQKVFLNMFQIERHLEGLVNVGANM